MAKRVLSIRRRSSAAAYLLSERGFDASVLRLSGDDGAVVWLDAPLATVLAPIVSLRKDIAQFLASATGKHVDLGRVEVVAEVWVNGRLAGSAWKEPYRVDITDTVRPGANDLAVRVTTLWPNRLIGDANGLSSLQGVGMGEGWGDFHSLLMAVREGDGAGAASVDDLPDNARIEHA